MKIKCPECDGDVEIPEDVVLGEIVGCPDCGLELEVCKIESGNAEVRPAEVEGEDWGE